MSDEPTITIERQDSILLIGLNRPTKRNAFNRTMLNELNAAYGELHRDPDLRCGVLFAHGDHFTGGLDLVDVAPAMREGMRRPEGGLDFFGLRGERVSKPIVVAVQGWCLTIGIELALACDVRVAASDTRFAQIEIKRGIFPTGGATIRFARECGWGNAMRYLLTGDEFGAEEALRIGLVQEVVDPGQQLERAKQIAKVIAAQAPLAVQATLRNARIALRDGEAKAVDQLRAEQTALMDTQDAREGMQAFVERRNGVFTGR